MPSQGDLQTTWNLIEAISDANQDVKAFRTHCQELFKKVEALNRSTAPLRTTTSSFSNDEAARDALEPLNLSLEECLGLLRKCATIGVMEKMFDKGETKSALEAASQRLTISSEHFSTWLNVANTRSGPESATLTEHALESGKSRGLETVADVPAVPAVALATVEPAKARLSSSQIYPDLL